MKKLFYPLITAVLMCLAVTSCSQEEDLMQSSSEMTTFSVNLSGVPQSRADIGKGQLVNKLYYAVYQDGEHVYPLNQDNSKKNGEVTISENKTELNLPILKGETYDIIFWAQNANTTVYDISNLREIKVKYDIAYSNQESYDAFYNALKGFKADGNNHRIELRRPFAQLNLGTSYIEADEEENMGDWQKASLALKDKNTPPVTHSSVTVDGLADTFIPLEGKADGDVEKTFQSAEIIKKTFTTNGKTYYNLSLNYLLIPCDKLPQGIGAYVAIPADEKALVDVAYTLYRGENNKLFTMNKISGVPVQRNYRTNIVGELLTSTEYDINITPDEDTPDTNQEIKSIKGLDALNAAMSAHTSTEPVIYNISGFSTTDAVIIEIPSGFNAEQATFNFTDIKDGATLTIQDAQGSTYTNSIYVNLPTTEGHNLASTNINLPDGHAEMLVGNFGTTTVTTSQTTFVVGKDAIIGALTVNGGNVEIQTGGVVEKITVGDEAGTIIVALGDNVQIPEGAEDNENIIIAGTDDATSTEETVYVAQVGEYKFTDLNTAIAAIAEEGEIKMIGNCNVASAITIPSDKTVTLELNGMTISQTLAQTGAYSMIVNSGTLTIKDTKGEGKISYADSGNGGEYASNTIKNDGTLTIEGGIIENNSAEAVASNGYPHPIDNNGILTINGGTITNNANYSSMRIWCTTDDNTIVTINGGKFNGSIDFHNVNANANKGTLTINDGTFIADTYTYSAVRLLGFGTDVDELNGYINGGTFNGSIKLNNYVGGKFNSQVFFITGGTFAEDPSAFLADGYLAEKENDTYKIVEDAIAKIGNTTYPTLMNAIEAVNDGGTITLLKDVTFTEKNRTELNGYYEGIYYEGDKSFTIDLNGKTINQNGAVNDYLLLFKNAGTKDNEITFKNGTIDAGTTAYCAICTSTSSTQKITINTEDINIIGENSNGSVLKIRSGAELNVNDGTKITGKDSYLGIENWKATVNIYDGAEIYMNDTESYNGCLVGVGGNGTVNVYGGYGKGAKGGFIAMTSGGTINVSGGEWIANTDGTPVYDNSGVLVSQFNNTDYPDAISSVINVTGGTFKGGYNCYGNVANKAFIKITGGNFNADPTGYLADGYKAIENAGTYTIEVDPAAQIGSTKYATLQEAFENVAANETITLLKNVEQADGIVITNKNITIDLNEKTFTVSEGASTNNRNFKIDGNSVVTIQNGTMIAAGDYSSGAYGTVRTEGTAKVTLENVKLYNYRGNGQNIKALEGTTVTINNSEVYSEYGGGIEAAGGIVELTNVKVEQKGMYIAPYNSMAISVNGGGIATVNSGTYTTECITAEEANGQGTTHGPWAAGVLNSGGKLIIKGGTFSNDNFGENNLATAARGLLLADTGANIQIEGGNFEALKSIIDIQNNLGDVAKNPSVTLSGGTFSADPLTWEGLIKVTEGYVAKNNENGTWSVVVSEQ